MKVFKFGGASVNSEERIRNIPDILSFYSGEKILIVISAMGKTTNALEKITDAFYAGNKDDSLLLFNELKEQHLSLCRNLLGSSYQTCANQLNDFFTEVEWLLHDKPVRDYNYYYDQVVCVGELLSTCIVSSYLNHIGLTNQWMDVRDIIRTDDDFRNAGIDWPYTGSMVNDLVLPVFKFQDLVITQGFIGATDENESTTLGREGSDYSAAVFANLLDAECQVIWKDVVSVMNADPKQFPDAISIYELNYKEVIEMAYYGAQVIHPKTIKPLQNKSIPLYVKCFLDPSLPGTIIHNKDIINLPPIIVLKEKQAMLKLTSNDFSFIGESHVGRLYELFEKLHIKPNLTQNGAISFVAVMDDWSEKVETMALAAAEILDVEVIRGLTLLTIRHYANGQVEKMTESKRIILKQQTPETVQVLFAN